MSPHAIFYFLISISAIYALTTLHKSGALIRPPHVDSCHTSLGSSDATFINPSSNIKVKPLAVAPKGSPPQKPPKSPASNKPSPIAQPPSKATPSFKVTRPKTPIDTYRVGEPICEDDCDNVDGLETDQIALARAVTKRGPTRSFEVRLAARYLSADSRARRRIC